MGWGDWKPYISGFTGESNVFFVTVSLLKRGWNKAHQIHWQGASTKRAGEGVDQSAAGARLPWPMGVGEGRCPRDQCVARSPCRHVIT